MNCKKCKKTIDDDSIYCKWCGSAQVKDKKKKMYQRPDGLYEKIITIDGKRVPFRGKSENEVYQKMTKYTNEVEAGEKFSNIADKWSDLTFDRISTNTLKGYKVAYNTAVDYFKDTPIKNITIKDVQKYIGTFIVKKFAYKTVKNYLLVLSLIFQHAIILGEIDNNPCIHVKIPANLVKTKRNIPNSDTITTILNSSSTFNLFPIFILYTGCRLGETLAITGADIDLDNKILNISKSVYFDGSKPKIKTPKTLSGVRQVPIPDVLIDKIPRINDEHFLFSNSGMLLTKYQFDKQWKNYKLENSIEVTPHQLRHYYATMLFNSGLDMKDSQHLLGHSNISTTMDIYTHLTESKKIKTFEKFNTYIKDTQNND